MKLENKINEEDSVQLSYFPYDYRIAFREMKKRQIVRRQLIAEMEYKLSVLMDSNIQENVKRRTLLKSNQHAIDRREISKDIEAYFT